MATVLFNILARYQGSRQMNSAARNLLSLGKAAQSTALLAKPAGAAMSGLAANVGAATAAFTSGAAALGAFGVAVIPQVQKMTETSNAAKKMAKAQEDAANKKQVADRLSAQGSKLAGKAEKAATSAKLKSIQATNAYKRSVEGLPASTASAGLALGKLKLAWEKWSDSLAPTTMPVFTRVFNTLRKAIPLLTPLVRTASQALFNFFGSMKDGVEKGGFKAFVTKLNKAAERTLPNILLSIKNVFVGLGGVIKAFLPSSGDFADSMENMTRKFANWGQGLEKSDSFKKFMSFVEENGPRLSETLGKLVDALVKITDAIKPLSMWGLLLGNAFLTIINNTPTPVLTVIIGLLIALSAAAKIWAIAQTIVTIRNRIWTASQWQLNASFLASPITWIVIGIMALIAAIVWIATKTTWFQTAWKYAWNAIKTAFWFVFNFIKTNWPLILAILAGPVGIAVLLIVSNWGKIKAGFFAAYNWVRLYVFNPIVRFFTVLIPGAAKYVKDRAVGFFKLMYAGLLAAWGWMRAYILNPIRRFFVSTIPNAAKYLWVRAVGFFRLMYQGWLNIWNWLRTYVLNPIRNFFTKTIPNAARVLRDKAVALFRSSYNGWAKIWAGFKSHVLNPMRNFFTKTIPGAVHTLKDKLVSGFRTMVSGIRTAWNKLKGVVKAPVKFFVQTVYNSGLRNAWNKTAGKIPGVPDLPHASLPKGFARGGHIGQGTRGPGDNVPIMAQAGEYVIRAKKVRELGRGYLDALNGSRPPRENRSVNGAAGSPGFALGGWIPEPIKKAAGAVGGAAGKVGSLIGKGFNWATDFTRDIAAKVLKTLFKPAKAAVSKITGAFPEAGIMSTAIKNFALDGFDRMIAFVESKAQDDAASPNVQKALTWAKKQAGKPYRWGGVGPGGYDCSGFMGAIQGVIEGKTPYRRRWATGAFHGSHAAKGWKRHQKSEFMVGITNRGVGHTAGTLGGVKVESRGGRGVVVGSQARGHKSGLFGSNWYGLKAAIGGGGKGGNWSQTVMAVLKELGLYSASNLRNVLKAIKKESGGNPKAINRWDSNAKRGQASRGLLQTIPSTFNAYAGKYRKRGIYDPYANIYAAVRYARSKYGKGWSARMARPGGYAEGGFIPSFDNGGTLSPGLNTVYNGTGAPEPLHRNETGGTTEYHVHVHGSVYAKSERQFEDLLVTALREIDRKGRKVL